jgi:hypothetical protein
MDRERKKVDKGTILSFYNHATKWILDYITDYDKDYDDPSYRTYFKFNNCYTNREDSIKPEGVKITQEEYRELNKNRG